MPVPTQRISDDPKWNYCLNLLLDDSISEVEANGPNEFFIKKGGRRIHLSNVNFDSVEEYAESIKEGLVPLMVSHVPFEKDGYIFEGPIRYVAEWQNEEKKIRGRCHIVLSPAADSPQVTIAKKSTSLATLDAIASKGSMATEMLHFVKAAIDADLTTILSGGTGAGKTTFLEAMCKLIDMDTRIGIAEDTPELDLPHPNATYLHSVPWRPGMDEKDVASLSWVVAQFNRMRTDKIIIGETRGKEFSDFLVAANSGMEGSLTTLHANEPVRALDKMTNFALKGAPGTPIRSINTDIATSIDLIIQLAYFKSDSRYRVTAIQEVTNVIGTTEAAAITTNRLYTYDSDNDIWTKDGNPTDSLRERFRLHNVDISDILRSAPGTKLYPTGGDPTEGRASGGLPVRRV
jgi:pilus assembly protein CpaF